MPAHFFLWPEERIFAIFFATPFSTCGLLASLSFFLKAEIPSDGEIVVRTAEKAKEPKLNLAVIGVYGFNPTFAKVYPKLKPSWMNEMEIPDALSLLISEGFKVFLDVMESVKRDVKMSRSSLRVARKPSGTSTSVSLALVECYRTSSSPEALSPGMDRDEPSLARSY